MIIWVIDTGEKFLPYLAYPYIRKAQSDDYDAIWAIWMQDHIIQWMSFGKQSKEEFRTHYARMTEASDIYVLIDKVNDQEKIVGVRRIKFGKNQYQHIAEYCSMAIDKDYQSKGYAKLFYQESEKIVRKAGIKRIQLTQSGGNLAAFHIIDKSFSEEAVFPDWLQRHNNNGDFYLIERYIYRFLDDKLAAIASKLPSLKYQEVIPPLRAVSNNAITVQRVNNQFIAYFKEKPLLTLDFYPDNSVIRHIGFLSIQFHLLDHQPEATLALQKILSDILEEGCVKKVELFTAELAVAELCRNTGFFVRGEKIASYYDDKEGYKNELGVEYSFFNIVDTQSLITAKMADPMKRESIASVLLSCSERIDALVKNKTCDSLGARYLENLVYQIVRDGLGLNKIFSLVDKRWIPLINEVPSALHNDLCCLQNRLQSTGIAPL
ncbi:Acetyltransferase (GNAT) family [Legionella lansingensis]|uniref:Acetyltransferase (GNAT) family protein n=1 Tax=Legionella lansingensis TaxID=45067 RepID=A0A0W0VXM3_9GAMM|nr:GNAT family N-acetyltransferase [Legionella lansingensis]KTD24983.1 Acetyltransferase (GNAT) family protein [Legionella lansingensis]SNV48287.1 Acetyltransferase (GNAT) family [Legionella lansingensis]